MTDNERIKRCIDLGFEYGGIQGDHHRAWVIDQMLRILCAQSYEFRVREHCNGEDGPNTYEWDEGIAP